MSKPELIGLLAGVASGAAIGLAFGGMDIGAVFGGLIGLILGSAWDLDWLAQRRRLFWAVAIPMGTLSLVSLTLSFVITDPWTNDLLIVATGTWIGVLVTVFYVEVILQQHQEEQWSVVEQFVKQEMRRIGNYTAMELSRSLPAAEKHRKLTIRALEFALMGSGDLAPAMVIHANSDDTFYLDMISRLIAEEERSSSIAKALAEYVSDIDKLTSMYISRIRPDTAQILFLYRSTARLAIEHIRVLSHWGTMDKTYLLVAERENFEKMSHIATSTLGELLQVSVDMVEHARRT